MSDYIIYNAKLVAALGKQVYIAEKLAPPTSLGEVVGGWATLWSRAKNVNYWAGLGKSGEWKTVAVYVSSAVLSSARVEGDGTDQLESSKGRRARMDGRRCRR